MVWFLKAVIEATITIKTKKMIKSILIFFLRNFIKDRKNTVINILGLVISLTCSLIIYHKIAYEVSFDHFHTQYESAYRVVKLFQPF